MTVIPGEPGHKTVEHAWKSEQLWLVESLPQIEARVQLAPHSVVHVDDVRDEAVPEPERRGGKLIRDPRVEGGVVVLAVTGGQWEESVGVDELFSQHNRQPLVVHDVLVLGVDKPLCLLGERSDPGHQFEWLHSELLQVEANGGLAILLGHYNPSSCQH